MTLMHTACAAGCTNTAPCPPGRCVRAGTGNAIVDAFDGMIERAEAPRNREADRARFPDPAFNRWLDEGIADGGWTVWDQIGSTVDAWAGWQNRAFYSDAPQSEAQPVARDLVLRVTTAYEQGFGHATRAELSNPYTEGSAEREAWDIGREEGARRAAPQPAAPAATPEQRTADQEQARTLAEQWHEGVPKAEQFAWACKAAGSLLLLSAPAAPAAPRALTDGDIAAMLIGYSPSSPTRAEAFVDGIRAAERAHGIDAAKG